MRLVADEPVLLTVHQSGHPDEQELQGHQYQVRIVGGFFRGFTDPADNSTYKSPSALCCAKLQRHGSKNTNQWRGPRHCLVLRNGTWTSLDRI